MTQQYVGLGFYDVPRIFKCASLAAMGIFCAWAHPNERELAPMSRDNYGHYQNGAFNFTEC